LQPNRQSYAATWIKNERFRLLLITFVLVCGFVVQVVVDLLYATTNPQQIEVSGVGLCERRWWVLMTFVAASITHHRADIMPADKRLSCNNV